MPRTGLKIYAAVAVAYAVGAQVAYDWFGAGTTPVFFPAAGVTVAALVLTPRALWLAPLAGAATGELLIDLVHGQALAPALGWAVANLTEATTGATLQLVARGWRRGSSSAATRTSTAASSA